MKINLFVFDWSGVISDDRKPVYKANMKVLEQYEKPTMTYEEWLPKTVMTPAEFFKKQGINDNPNKLFELYKKYYTELFESGIKPQLYGDVNLVLSHLLRINKKIAVLSSHPEENLIKEAEDYGVVGYITLILGNSKDKSDGLIQISEQLEERLENMLYVGDTIHDIMAGKKAGTYTTGISGNPQRGYHSKEILSKEKPNFLLDSLYDLMDEKFL